MQYRGVTRRGTLVFGGVKFSTQPRLYQMTAEEASVLQSLYGDRLTLEALEPDLPEGNRGLGRRRVAAAEVPAESEEEESQEAEE